jgi:hypothetical protein
LGGSVFGGSSFGGSGGFSGSLGFSGGFSFGTMTTAIFFNCLPSNPSRAAKNTSAPMITP